MTLYKAKLSRNKAKAFPNAFAAKRDVFLNSLGCGQQNFSPLCTSNFKKLRQFFPWDQTPTIKLHNELWNLHVQIF